MEEGEGEMAAARGGNPQSHFLQKDGSPHHTEFRV